MLKPIDTQILTSVGRYYTLLRSQITRLHLPWDDDGRETRERLQQLLKLRLVNRCRMEVVNPNMGAPAPVYYPSEDGCAYLAQELEDPTHLAACTQTPNWQHLYHWVQVAETHISLDRAVGQTDGVTVPKWYGEWDVVNPDERLPHKRFRLYTLLSETPKVVCVPDAGFVLDAHGAKRAFYLELDRDTTKNAERVAAQKFQGYFGLAERRLHLRHFLDADPETFRVLTVAPTGKRRDALRKAVGQRKGSWLWWFASAEELKPETFLTGKVWYKCATDDAVSVLKQDGAEKTLRKSIP